MPHEMTTSNDQLMNSIHFCPLSRH